MTYMMQLRNEQPALCVYVFKNGIVTYSVVAQVTLAAVIVAVVFMNRQGVFIIKLQASVR